MTSSSQRSSYVYAQEFLQRHCPRFHRNASERERERWQKRQTDRCRGHPTTSHQFQAHTTRSASFLFSAIGGACPSAFASVPKEKTCRPHDYSPGHISMSVFVLDMARLLMTKQGNISRALYCKPSGIDPWPNCTIICAVLDAHIYVTCPYLRTYFCTNLQRKLLRVPADAIHITRVVYLGNVSARHIKLRAHHIHAKFSVAI